MSQIIDFIDKNKDRFLEGLVEILEIESVSTQPEKKPEILKCADLTAKKCQEIGLENVQLLETPGYPIVYGDWLHAEGKPTILIYGHYDVQPPDPLEQWKSPPFEPTVRDGNLYARGATDNKGQFFSHFCAIEAYLKTVGKLPVNVKVMIEGEEESSSTGIEEYVPKNAKFLECDAVLVSDTSWFDAEHPSICLSLRGMSYFEIKVKGPSHDLHSGMHGGLVRNPLQVVSWILAQLKDESEKILIPHLYDDVQDLSPADKEDIRRIPFNEKARLKEVGTTGLVSEKGFTPLESNWGRPALDICGMWGGYQAPGAKTIIPAEAGAKVSIRLVANQDPKKIAKHFTDYVKSLCPKECSVEVTCFAGAPAMSVDRDNYYIQQTVKGYEEGFGKKILFVREGASIPVTCTFQEVLKVPVILIGIGLPDDRLHSPNEKISLKNFYDGIKGAALAYQALAEKE